MSRFWSWIRIRSQIFSFLVILDHDSNQLQSGIITPIEVLLFPAWIRSQIFSFLAIRDPVKSGIVTPLVPTDCRCLVKYSDLCMRFRQKCVPGCPRWRASCGGPSQPRWAPPCRWSPTRPCRRSRRRQCPGAAWSPGECFTVPFWIYSQYRL